MLRKNLSSPSGIVRKCAMNDDESLPLALEREEIGSVPDVSHSQEQMEETQE